MVRASLGGLEDVVFAEAASGLDAIEHMALAPVDLMVLDINMPDMHGLDVLRFVRQHQSRRPVFVIVLTTRGDDGSRENALAAGANLYMIKPFQPDNLLAQARAPETAKEGPKG